MGVDLRRGRVRKSGEQHGKCVDVTRGHVDMRQGDERKEWIEYVYAFMCQRFI